MKDLQEKQLHEALVLACPELKDAIYYGSSGTAGAWADGEPRLSHVLRAIPQVIHLKKLGSQLRIVDDTSEPLALEWWDLEKDSLSEQSPELKSWLHSILCAA